MTGQSIILRFEFKKFLWMNQTNLRKIIYQVGGIHTYYE